MRILCVMHKFYATNNCQKQSIVVLAGETTFAAGAEVTMNFVPTEGYELETLTVTKKVGTGTATVTVQPGTASDSDNTNAGNAIDLLIAGNVTSGSLL